MPSFAKTYSSGIDAYRCDKLTIQSITALIVQFRSFLAAETSFRYVSSIEVICSHQELQAEISWNIHVSYTITVFVFFIVVKVFDNFLKHDAAQIF